MWTWDPAAAAPGLVLSGIAPCARLLTLEGMACGPSGAGLTLLGAPVRAERLHDRVIADYTVTLGGEVAVRATWMPTHGLDGVDLFVEASTPTVGEVADLRLIIGGSMPGARSIQVARASHVPEHRGELGFMPPAVEATITLVRDPAFAGRAYVELVLPLGLAGVERPSITSGLLPRYAFFGGDLERGVVVRGRVRGAWVPDGEAELQADALWHAFRSLPPALD